MSSGECNRRQRLKLDSANRNKNPSHLNWHVHGLMLEEITLVEQSFKDSGWFYFYLDFRFLFA